MCPIQHTRVTRAHRWIKGTVSQYSTLPPLSPLCAPKKTWTDPHSLGDDGSLARSQFRELLNDLQEYRRVALGWVKFRLAQGCTSTRGEVMKVKQIILEVLLPTPPPWNTARAFWPCAPLLAGFRTDKLRLAASIDFLLTVDLGQMKLCLLSDLMVCQPDVH